MNINLTSFQNEAVQELRENAAAALEAYRRRQKPQVISLQAPTGSGKTIIAAALIESICFGSVRRDGTIFEEQPEAIFVWLSDSPELNEQSKQKIMGKSDRLNVSQFRTITEEDFNLEQLEDGKIYFLNTQKLSKTGKLTQHSDTRQYTIWETLDNTIQQKSDRLYFIIDEAHRGAKTKQDADTSIMQRFIRGYEYADEEGNACNMRPMPVVLGISATAERFNALVSGISGVDLHPYIVEAEKVRESGLLKESIFVTYPENPEGNQEIELLGAAVEEWQEKCEHWRRYTAKERCPEVDPVLVVQVRQGRRGEISDTNLEDVLAKIEEKAGRRFQKGEVVHCFGNESAIELNGVPVPYVKASDIADDHKIRVVLFKEALSTGWDCPRAETMMSFAVRNDPTYIAQLLGRMVRTPLQRRIETDEFLNDVKLFLPNYDKDTVQQVIEELQGLIPARIEGNPGITWTVHTRNLLCNGAIERADVVCYINELGIRTFEVHRARSGSYLDSCFNLTALLTSKAICPGARKEVVDDVVGMIRRYVEEQRRNGKYDELAQRVRELKLSSQVFDSFGQVIQSDRETRTFLSEADMERLERNTNARLGKYGFPNEYGKKHFNSQKPHEYKIDCAIFASDDACLEKLEAYAKTKLNEFSKRYHEIIATKGESTKSEFKKFTSHSDEVNETNFEIPETVTNVHEDPEGKEYDNHLLASEDSGVAKIRLNGWEAELIEEESHRPDFVCWLRNPPRKEWAFCIMYEAYHEKKLFYPDFLVVRKDSGGYHIDLLEPHGDQFSDNLPKVKALAEYAEKENHFGRIEIIHKVKDSGGSRFIRLDLTDREVQEKVLHINTDDELNNIFRNYGK